MECEACAYYEYDEEEDAYYCSVNLDEDDMARFMSRAYKRCPYFIGLASREPSAAP